MAGERSLRATFDAAAATYHAACPDYPAALYDDVVAEAGLEPAPGVLLLETGWKATGPLLERELAVVAVELSEALAERARREVAGTPGSATCERIGTSGRCAAGLAYCA